MINPSANVFIFGDFGVSASIINPALLDLFLASDANICSTMAFPPWANSDHFIVSVFIDFPSNSKWDVLFYHKAYDCSLAD